MLCQCYETGSVLQTSDLLPDLVVVSRVSIHVSNMLTPLQLFVRTFTNQSLLSRLLRMVRVKLTSVAYVSKTFTKRQLLPYLLVECEDSSFMR